MKMTKLSLVAILAVSAAFAGGDIEPMVEPVVEAPVVVEPVTEESAFEASANMAITSNYVWRGLTQSSNNPAIQGGIDFGFNGLYVGTWLSNVDYGDDAVTEADFYGGYAGEIAGLGFDLGYIIYKFPASGYTEDLEEVYLGLSKDFDGFGISGKYSYSLNDDVLGDYWEVGASVALPADITLAAGYGDQEGANGEDFGTNYIVSLAKTFGNFEVSVAYTDFSSDDDTYEEDNVVATISASF